jgi:hypothetical protein
MSKIQVDTIVNKTDDGAPDFPNGATIVGILTVGTSSITLNGSENQVNVGTGVTLHHTNGVQVGENTVHSSGLTINQLNASGIITATSFIGDGSGLTGVSSWESYDSWLFGGG